MPPRYVKRNVKKVRRTRRRTMRYARKTARTYRPHNVVDIRGLSGHFLPQRATTVHKYQEVVLRTSTSGILDDYQFNLNSMFDPNRTGGGHQPMGRDTMAQLYNRYRVDKAIIKVTFVRYTANIALWAAISGNNSGTAFTNPLTAIGEQPYVVQSRTTSALEGKANLVFKKSFDLHKLTGVTKRKYEDDDRYQAEIGSDPAEAIVLHCCGADLLETNTCVYALHIEAQFFTTWFDPFVVAQS